MGNKEIIFSGMDKQWHQTPQTVRDDYGVRESENLKKSINAFLNLTIPDTSEVVNTIIEAITVDQPDTHYKVCRPLAKAICIDGLQLFPEEVQDILMSEPTQSTTFRGLKLIRDKLNIW